MDDNEIKELMKTSGLTASTQLKDRILHQIEAEKALLQQPQKKHIDENGIQKIIQWMCFFTPLITVGFYLTYGMDFLNLVLYYYALIGVGCIFSFSLIFKVVVKKQ